ncbi:hypothetical protein EW145_g5117 [Phellinidium pouzarii]|uniref:Uncharacterized protein n=1 Tax=Phellinidium pouzarii TaxID=167371 RepID=A0A4S4L2H5_9AGAM|nr:hypothetical protein EW145_g5117 [Phellinidium pouzarii]
MKIFLGVLEDDVLGVDVGLEEVDPRRLANGEREEVAYVAEVLCWLGKKMNYLSKDGLSVGNMAYSRDNAQGDAYETAPLSPSVHSTASTSRDSSLLMHSTRSLRESQTTVSNHDASEDELFALSFQPSYHHTPSFFEDPDAAPMPSRINEVDDFPPTQSRRRREVTDFMDEVDSEEDQVEDSFCHCPLDSPTKSNNAPSIRTSGYLEHMSFDDELKSYEAWKEETAQLSPRSRSHTHSAGRPKPRLSGSQFLTPSRDSTKTHSPTGIITRHTSPSQHTLALLDERARLLSELSHIISRRRE